jgi:phage shock protein PspC (stress-responsive transcriptional regulator)
MIGDDFMGELITTYWWLFIVIFAAGCVIGNYIINFFKLPSSS